MAKRVISKTKRNEIRKKETERERRKRYGLPPKPRAPKTSRDRIIEFTVTLPIHFPDMMTNRDVEEYLNSEKWCADDLMFYLAIYAKQHGCCCDAVRCRVVGRADDNKGINVDAEDEVEILHDTEGDEIIDEEDGDLET